VRDVLEELSRSLSKPYVSEGRPSIPPEQLLSALLLQVFCGIRSERQLMEQLDYNLLYRWFVGLSLDDPCGTRPVHEEPRPAAERRCVCQVLTNHPIRPPTLRQGRRAGGEALLHGPRHHG
jgi:transposase